MQMIRLNSSDTYVLGLLFLAGIACFGGCGEVPPVVAGDQDIGPDESMLLIEPAIVDFGQDDTSIDVAFTNTSEYDLSIEISTSYANDDENWLTVTPAAAECLSGQGVHFSIAVDRKNLPAGLYVAQVELTAGGINKTVDVRMTVPAAAPQPDPDPVIPTLSIQPSTTSSQTSCPIDFVAVEGSEPAVNLPAGSTLSWDFGDDSPVAFGTEVSHTFTRAGTFTVVLNLTLVGGLGTVGCGQATVKISPAAAQYGFLEVIPAEGFSATGLVGGPFSPAGKTYTVRNPGSTAIAWTAGTAAPIWVHVSKTGGVLAAGATDTVTVNTNATAAGLAAGSFGGAVTFVNTSNHLGDTSRSVNLEVSAWPASGSVQFKAATYTVAENVAGGTVRIYVSRTEGSYGAASVNYATANDTAAAGSDYTAKSGTLSWADGDTADKYFDVVITDDVAYESNETFKVSLSSASGVSLGSPSQTTVTITNDDPAPPAGILSVTPTTGLSPTGPQGGPFSPTSIAYTLSNTGGADLAWTAGKTQSWVTLSKISGVLSAGSQDTVVVSINDQANTLAEGTHTDTVTFTNTTDGSGNTTRSLTLTVTSAETAGAPTAMCAVSCSRGQAPLTVLLDASGSYDGDGHVSDYAWDFADEGSVYTAKYGIRSGQQINGRYDYGRLVAHRFDSPGMYVVRLTVTDDEGKTASAETTITVDAFAGTTYYVRADGSDQANGLSDATAWATLGKAGTAISSGLIHAGDRVLFRRGDTFTGHVYINACAGTKAYPITLGAYGTGERPILQQSADADDSVLYLRGMPEGSGLAFQGLHIRRTAWTTGSALTSYYWQNRTYPNFMIRDCRIEGGYDALSYLYGASLTIEDSIVHGAQRQGLKADSPNTLVRHCYFHNNGTSTSFDHNIYLTDTNDSLIEDCLLEQGSSAGLAVHGVISNLVIRRNDVSGNNVGISVTGGYSTAESFTDVWIDSNRIRGNPNMGIYANSLVRGIISNNLIYNSGTTNGSINLSAGTADDPPTSDTLVAHNVLYGDGTLVGLNLNRAGSSATVMNNILHYYSQTALRYCISHTSQLGQLQSNRNVAYSPLQSLPFCIAGFNKSLLQWQAAGFDTDGLLTDPRMVDPAGGEFQLQPTSPAIGFGQTLWQVPRDCIGGVRGSSPDAGAYQQ